jgi:uncharacterized protein YlxW (UPF0749 family)
MKHSCKIGFMLAFALCALLLFRIEKCTKDSPVLVNIEATELQHENDSLQMENNRLELQANKLKQRADSLEKLVAANQIKVEQLEQYKYERLKAIDGFSSNELFRFFSGFDTCRTAKGQ